MRLWQARALTRADQTWVEAFIRQRWGATEVVVHDEVLLPAKFPGFVCEDAGEVLGLVTYRLQGEACEIVSLDSLRENEGIASALMQSVEEIAAESECSSVWLVTTNDNLRALKFYQKRGYRLESVAAGTVTRSRRIKPSIPLIGENGIPLRDELTLRKSLNSEQSGNS